MPLFADPIDWDKTKTYEPLTIVYHQGNSYTSRQSVHAGVDITDTTYWALTGNYNAQIEQYRKETASKLDTVTTDGTLHGAGTKTDPLNVRLNHSTVMSDTGKTVYPTLMHKQGDSGTILGIGFNVGDGLDSYNTEDPDIGSGLRLDQHIQTSIEQSEQSLTALGASTTDTAAAAKKKWDDADTRSQQQAGQINDLTNDINDLTNDITSLRKRVNLLEGLDENILILGDSISYGTGHSTPSKSWANQLAAYRGCTVTNLAQNNAGYVNAPTFLSQAQSYTGDKTQITRVLIVGGANDKTHVDGTDDDSTITTAVTNTITWIRNNYPNARIQTIPCLLGFLPPTRYNPNIWKVISRIQIASGKLGIECIPYAWEWLAGNPNWTADYSIHPNDYGSQILLHNIANAIDGQSIRAEWTGTISGADNHGIITNSIFHVAAGTVNVACQMKVVNNHAAYQAFARMPYAATQGMNFYIANSLEKLVYVDNNVQKHTADVCCTSGVANDTEIYFTFVKALDS